MDCIGRAQACPCLFEEACNYTHLVDPSRWRLDPASCGGGAASACTSLRAVDEAGEDGPVELACEEGGGPCGLACDGNWACVGARLGCPDGRECTLPAFWLITILYNVI